MSGENNFNLKVKMSSEFNPLLWFVCKICRQAFPDTDKLKKHQIRKHAEDCKNVKCIVFEERLFDKQWIPSDNYFPESNSEFTNETLIEVAPLTTKCGCQCHSTSAVPAETQTESFLQLPMHEPNPYVLVKRLTSEELNTALNRHAEKRIFQSNGCSEERKRTSRCLNNEDDVQSPKQTKEYFNHQENHQDPGQELLADQSKFVSPPELLQNIVTQTAELSTRVLPEPDEISPTDPLSANFYPPPSCFEERIENVQNSEENRLEEAVSFTLLEGEIHVELLSVTKQIKSSTEHSDPVNQRLPKSKSHKRSPLSAEEQTRNAANKSSKPNQSPYVLVKRLTFGGLNTSITQNSEKRITIKSITRCKERKRFREDYNLSPPAIENCLQHRNQEQDFPAGENHLVFNSELFQEIVAPKAEPDRDAISENGQFSSIISLGDPPVNALSDIKYVANIQNIEENNEQLPTGTQILEYQEQHFEEFGSSVSTKIWCSRSDFHSTDTSTLAQPSVTNFGSLNISQVNDDNENLSETNHAERIPIIRDVDSQASVTEGICPSDSECFEMENPISPGLSDEVEFVEEHHLPTSVVSEIGVSDDDIQLTQGSDTENTQFDGQPHCNEELSKNTVFATSSACPIPFSALTATHASPELESLDTSKNGQPRYSTRAKRKKPEVNYSESHICSGCNLDFDSFDDLQDHQTLCKKRNRVDSVIRSDENSLQVSLISSSANSGKVKKITLTVTDGDSDYAAAGDEDVSDSDSENENNNYVLKPMPDVDATVVKLWKRKTNKNPAPKNILLLHQSLNVDSLDVNLENPVTCKLCATKLISTLEVKLHSENCWLHNKYRHVFCTICDQRFNDPAKLRDHNSNQHQLSKTCAPSEDEKNQQSNRTEPEKNPSLRQWLTIYQEIDPKNIIALEPDPLTSVTVTVSDSSPVKCRLCYELLTTEADLKTHVTTCWLHNKAKHCYCIPCNLNFATNSYLLVHNQAKHLNDALTSLTCLKCNHEFPTESEFAKHKESLGTFLNRRNKTKSPKVANLIGSAASSNTMAYLFEWLKGRRQIKNLDGSENIILVDPEPTANNFEKINFDNPITCLLCQLVFTTAMVLRSHIRDCWTRNKGRHRYCVICKNAFKKPQILQDHTKTEHSETQRDSFTCAFCDQEFFDEKTIEEHEEAHKDPNFLPFKCPHCSESFTDKNILLKHVTVSHKGLRKVAGHKCKICLKSFPAPNALNDHNRSVHTRERPFICKFPNCSFACSYKGNRQLHYRTKHREESGLEPQQFSCPTCGKTFKEQFLVTVHLKRSHTQDRAYKCTHEGCTKAYKNKNALTEHVRVHTGEKPYVCEECGKSFAREWGFIKHKRSHAGTLNRAQCHLCPRKFLGGWELKQHLKIHQERKQFKCQFCKVECATASYLKKHEKTHGNERGSSSEEDSKSSTDSDV